jgi:hypothetical protein
VVKLVADWDEREAYTHHVTERPHRQVEAEVGLEHARFRKRMQAHPTVDVDTCRSSKAGT